MSAQSLIDVVLAEADKFFASYPKGIDLENFKACKNHYNNVHLVLIKVDMVPDDDKQIEELFKSIDTDNVQVLSNSPRIKQFNLEN